MYKPISVCIPAYNEERCIGQTIDSIFKQDYPGEMEIIVCANGCSDNTADIVRDFNVKLSETGERGKPNAWNILRREASHDYMFFTDGDVRLKADAFRHMYDRLSQGDITAVGGRIVPVFDNCSWLTKVNTVVPYPQKTFGGGLYAFDNEKLETVLEGKDMPKDIINEDLWLNIKIGKGNYAIENNAEVYYTPMHWTESVKMACRSIRGNLQIRNLFGYSDEFSSTIDSTRAQISRAMEKLRYAKGMKRRCEMVLGFAMRKAVLMYAWQKVKHEPAMKGLEGWEVAESTKR